MEQRSLGNTGVRVSCVGFGGGAYAGLLVRGTVEQQASAVKRAIDAGLTYFDTAAQYGDGVSEDSLGRALAAAGATNQAVIGTKVRLEDEDLANPSAAIRASLIESLKRLRRDYVDVFVQHNFPRVSPGRNYVLKEQLPAIASAMRDLQREGLVRSVGLTGVGDTSAVIDAVKSGLFDYVQCYFNVLNPSAVYGDATGGGQNFEGAISLANQLGVSAMAVRSVAGGALAANDYRAPLAGPTSESTSGLGGAAYSSDLERAQRLQPLVDELGLESVFELGVRFNISHPSIATSLVGFSDEEQIMDAIRWAERGPLPAAAVAKAVELARGPLLSAQVS
jgi:aryl-alcohol dehydrogenase-like predicted oxidoreductase